jgi:hypothetical protein
VTNDEDTPAAAATSRTDTAATPRSANSAIAAYKMAAADVRSAGAGRLCRYLHKRAVMVMAKAYLAESTVAPLYALEQSHMLQVPPHRQSAPPHRAEQRSWPQVWPALDQAQANYDPQILDTAEKGVLECYRPAAPAVANNAAPAHGLDQLQAEALAELALIKSIRQCRAWNIHGFELYVHAAVESELRTNARPAPVPPIP